MSHSDLVLLGAAVIGLIMGAVGQISGFCLMRGLHNAWTQRDSRKLRAFSLAMALALLVSQLLVVTTDLSLNNALYLQTSVSWFLLPIGAIIFGYGMVLANGCGARALVLLGQGNLRSFVVLLCVGLAAFMTLSGVLAPIRLWLEPLTTVRLPASHLPGLLSLTGLDSSLALCICTILLAGSLAFWALKNKSFIASRADLISGVVVGLLVAAGWWVTGVLGNDFFTPTRLASLTFVAPIGESIQYLMISTGMAPTFGIAVVGGILFGSFITAVLRGSFQWEGFNSVQHMQKSALGGMLMGIGGALALGCSIGQGLTGFSTLSLTSLIAIAGIVFGAWLGIKSFLKVN